MVVSWLTVSTAKTDALGLVAKTSQYQATIKQSGFHPIGGIAKGLSSSRILGGFQ
jgi:hypothetical protein